MQLMKRNNKKEFYKKKKLIKYKARKDKTFQKKQNKN